MKHLPVLSWVAGLVCIIGAVSVANGVEETWSRSPYAVEFRVAVSASAADREQITETLTDHLRIQSFAQASTIWRPRVVNRSISKWRRELLAAEDGKLVLADSAGESKPDKVYFIYVAPTNVGVLLSVQELDVRVGVLGPYFQQRLLQSSRIAEQVFRLVRVAFSPTVRFAPSDRAGNVVDLEIRGSDLKASPQFLTLAEGDLLVPALAEEYAAGGESSERPLATPIPWTYLQVAAPDTPEGDSGPQPWSASVVSGLRNPLRQQRRGPVEPYAVVVRPQQHVTTLELKSTDAEPAPLVGYQIFAREGADESLRRLGGTDLRGQFVLHPGNQPLRMLYIKSGELVLARLPVVNGLHSRLTIRLPNDSERLKAEQALLALRTELIDIVARRNIRIARIKDLVAKQEYAQASEVFALLEDLPTRAAFDARIDAVERTAKSDDPLTQQRIDRLVSDTRGVLAKYLDPREVQSVGSLLSAAKRSAPSSGS